MLAIIGGCGRVGNQLATSFSMEGHDVVVIDKDPLAFQRLPSDFRGRTLPGIVFDRQTLEAAGIRKAGWFVAVTSGDNSNIVSARTAKERYGVERVVARIYDPRRAEIFERLPIDVVASARWTAEAIRKLLAPDAERIDGTLGPHVGDVLMVTMKVPEGVHGVPAAGLNRAGHWVLCGLTRSGNTVVPPAGALLESADYVHLSVERASLVAARQALSALALEHA